MNVGKAETTKPPIGSVATMLHNQRQQVSRLIIDRNGYQYVGAHETLSTMFN